MRGHLFHQLISISRPLRAAIWPPVFNILFALYRREKRGKRNRVLKKQEQTRGLRIAPRQACRGFLSGRIPAVHKPALRQYAIMPELEIAAQ